MLVHDAQELRKAVEQYLSIRTDKTQLQLSRQRATELSATRERVHNLRATLALLRQRRITHEPVGPLAENVTNIISRIGALAIQSGGLGRPEAGPLFAALGKSGNAALQQIETNFLRVWQSWLDEQVSGHDLAALAEWDHVPDFRNVARNIRTIHTKLSGIRQSLPTDPSVFTEIQTLITQLKQAWKQIENTPAKVLKFLREAASINGAPLSLLDDEVLEWLRKRNLENSFKVRTFSS